MESGTGKTGNGKKIVIISFIGIVIAGLSYYFLIYKPKADALKKTADAKAAALAAGKTVSVNTSKKPVSSSSGSHPVNTNAGLNTGTGNSSDFDPTPYTDNIHKDLNSSFLIPHSATPYETANDLSDDDLVAVYNDWIDRYYSVDGKNMVDAIQSSGTTFNFEWASATAALVDRLNTL